MKCIYANIKESSISLTEAIVSHSTCNIYFVSYFVAWNLDFNK